MTARCRCRTSQGLQKKPARERRSRGAEVRVGGAGICKAMQRSGKSQASPC